MSKYQYGFELEGFATALVTTISAKKDESKVVLPPLNWPTDGFPGLVEIRTTGGASLEDAYFNTIRGILALPPMKIHEPVTGPGPDVLFCHQLSEYTFSPIERAELRKRGSPAKSPADIRNLYGKPPRALGNKTLASFQINISLLLCESYTVNRHKKNGAVTIPAKYGLLDVPKIVRALDETFKEEISLSKRQPGFYAIKGDRLEYRSLPNWAFPTFLSADSLQQFLTRIRDAVENS